MNQPRCVTPPKTSSYHLFQQKGNYGRQVMRLHGSRKRRNWAALPIHLDWPLMASWSRWEMRKLSAQVQSPPPRPFEAHSDIPDSWTDWSSGMDGLGGLVMLAASLARNWKGHLGMTVVWRLWSLSLVSTVQYRITMRVLPFSRRAVILVRRLCAPVAAEPMMFVYYSQLQLNLAIKIFLPLFYVFSIWALKIINNSIPALMWLLPGNTVGDLRLIILPMLYYRPLPFGIGAQLFLLRLHLRHNHRRLSNTSVSKWSIFIQSVH